MYSYLLRISYFFFCLLIISGHITFDEFLYVFALLALAMTTSISHKYGVPLASIANSDADMGPLLLSTWFLLQ